MGITFIISSLTIESIIINSVRIFIVLFINDFDVKTNGIMICILFEMEIAAVSFAYNCRLFN